MDKVNCIQFNFGTNKDRLVKFYKNRTRFSFTSHFYYPNDTKLYFGLTNNSARVVLEDLTEDLFPGHDTYVALSKTEQTALGPPHSQCNDSEGYSQLICTENCFNKNITESCGCDYPVECVNTTETTQVNFYERSELCKRSYDISDLIWSNCRIKCPVECSQVIFSFNRMDFEIHVKPYYLDIFKSVAEKKFNITDTGSEQFVERLTSICVYFDRFETTQITQSESISLTSLIANVGGLLGEYLFLN